MNYLILPIGQNAPQTVTAVIEVPQGQANKYEYDKALHVFRLDRPLYASVHYPGEYGFIPSTLSEDGDALDILVLAAHSTFPGCIMEARPVGLLNMLDQKVKDQKILAVSARSPAHQGIQNHSDLPRHVLREIEHFFAIYKELEGKKTEVKGWQEVRQARRLIQASHQRFLKQAR